MTENLELEAVPQPDPAPVAPPQKSKLKINLFIYEGLTGELFKIWLVNIFMRIITLGIYGFWGKTRIRKYVYGSFSLDGDRFEYTGTGGELFKGFLKVMPVLVVLFGPFFFASADALWPFLLYIPMFYLFGVAIYGAMRYRFSRTRWRGIRGRLSGSAFKYANISALRWILNIITLGFAIPYSDIAKYRYMMNNAYFGNVKAEYKGNAQRIYGAYIKSIFVMIAIMAIPATIFALPIIFEAMYTSTGSISVNYAAEMPREENFGEIAEGISTSINWLPGLLAAFAYLFGIMLAVLLLPVSRCVYTAALMREQMRGLVVGDLRFKSTVTAWKLFKHQLGNVFWIILTLGLATAHVINRRAIFMAENTKIGGDLNTSAVMQGKDDGLTSGEGLEDALDLDVGFI